MKPSKICTVIRAFRDSLPELYPGCTEVPKTIIFAKNDSSADGIIQTVRAEFAEGNDFCKKVTTKDPKAALADFCNSYNPRIGVTVDMIVADVKPLEYLIVMRDVLFSTYQSGQSDNNTGAKWVLSNQRKLKEH